MATVLAVELDDGLSGCPRASEKIKDYRVWPTGDGNEVLEKPYGFREVEDTCDAESFF